MWACFVDWCTLVAVRWCLVFSLLCLGLVAYWCLFLAFFVGVVLQFGGSLFLSCLLAFFVIWAFVCWFWGYCCGVLWWCLVWWRLLGIEANGFGLTGVDCVCLVFLFVVVFSLELVIFLVAFPLRCFVFVFSALFCLLLFFVESLERF